jgi:ABC-type xylose transport system permease subunit
MNSSCLRQTSRHEDDDGKLACAIVIVLLLFEAHVTSNGNDIHNVESLILDCTFVGERASPSVVVYVNHEIDMHCRLSELGRWS